MSEKYSGRYNPEGFDLLRSSGIFGGHVLNSGMTKKGAAEAALKIMREKYYARSGSGLTTGAGSLPSLKKSTTKIMTPIRKPTPKIARSIQNHKL